MADVAELGFSVNTADLDKAVTKLNALKPAAAGVVAASNKMSAAVEGASASAVAATTAIARADAAVASATLKRMQASQSATKEDIESARQIQRKTKLALDEALAMEKVAIALKKEALAQKESNAAKRLAFAAGSSVQMGNSNAAMGPSLAVNNGRTIARDAAPNKFNTANIAAQFQDIGVTAAMGMNPLMIAMQQGTQLAAIMNSMQNPARGLAEALKQVFNVMSLGTIAVIALVAGLLQMVNWIKVAQGALYALATGIQVATPYVLGLAVALALIYSSTIISGLASLTVMIVNLGITALAAGGRMSAAWLLGLGPLGAAVVAIGVLTAAFQALGVNAVGILKKLANAIIGAFVGSFNAVKAIWAQLPAVMGDLVIQAVNIVLKKIEMMVNGTVDMINQLVRATGGTEIKFKADIQIDNPFKGKAAEAGKIAGEEFAKAQGDYVGKAMTKAQQLADAAAKGIRKYASHLGDEKEKKGPKTPEEKYQDVLDKADRKIATMKAERDAIGLSEFATAKLKYETELLNDADEKGIILTAAGRAELMGRANDMAVLATETANLKEAFEFARETTKGFFQDMKSGLQEGKGLWESFGSAVSNVLDKILNKMLDSGVDVLFGGSGGGVGGGGAGVLGSLFGNLLGSFGTGGGGDYSSPPTDSSGLLGLLGFAKGGAFTNSLVNRPTPFAFAGGGQFGVMGEAGPEAVMPLHRGSDGSLGVKMSGGGSASSVVVNINNYGDSKVTTQQRSTPGGMEIDVMIDEINAKNISQQGSASTRALNARDNRALISR